MGCAMECRAVGLPSDYKTMLLNYLCKEYDYCYSDDDSETLLLVISTSSLLLLRDHGSQKP